MKIEHVAIWVNDLEGYKKFFEKYFGARSTSKYENPKKHFQSYFLNFNSGARLELMHRTNIEVPKNHFGHEYFGFSHLAISVGSKLDVNSLTERLLQDGYQVINEPRYTGDGYYESVVLDLEGNKIEITI